MSNIRYIANAGFLIEYMGKKIMIDAIHVKQIDPYYNIDNQTINKIINGVPPFDNISLFLFTHYHPDHFDGEAILQTLSNHPNTKLFSSKQTVEYLKGLSLYDISLEQQLIYDELELNTIKDFNINGIRFSALSLTHDGKNFKDIVNFAYLLNFKGQRIYHCGDAKPDLKNYENLGLNKLHIDYALLGFPYITLPSARKVINEYIKPEKVLLMHMPNKEKDEYNWLESIYKVVDRYGDQLPELILCEEPNKVVSKYTTCVAMNNE